MQKPMNVFGPNTTEIFQRVHIEKGRTPLVYFSSNTYSMNYYFLAQLFYIGELNKHCRINVALVLNDLSQRKIQDRGNEEEPNPVKKSDVLTILTSFGIPKESIKIHMLSEGWHNYLSINEQAPFDFMHNLVFLDKQIIRIPESEVKLDFLLPKASYEIYYVLQKYIDLIISANYQKIFPNDFDNEVDIHLTSSFSYPLLEKIRKNLIKKASTYIRLPHVFALPKIPFFGKSRHIFPEHIVPSMKMSLAEINRSVIIYNLDSNEINLMYKNLLTHALNKKYSEINHLTLAQKRTQLAEDLYLFIKNLKGKITLEEKDKISLTKGTTDSKEILRLFKSQLTSEIIQQCNGQNKITDIARKLNKHQPNISKTISKLKKYGIIRMNSDNKPIKATNKIEIEL